MSHVDDGTLHAYLDGELSPAEAQGLEAHLAQCPSCRGRLEEERALIRRAGELLALAAPPDRELPPFRAGDVKPPARAWWQVRLPLAWAATVVLALGLGTYLGSGVEQLRKSETAADAKSAGRRALEAPLSSELAQRESRVKVRGPARTPPAPQPAAPAPAARNEAAAMAQERDARVVDRAEASSALGAANPAPAPQAGILSLDGERHVLKGSPISVDTARVLLGTDPLVVPGAPIRAIYRAREIGYSVVVIVEQALDSSTVIEVINARSAPVTLEAVVVTGAQAGAALPDSVTVSERAQADRSRRADSLAALPRDAALRRAAQPAANRTSSDLFREVRGPLSADSLAALRRLLRPLRR